MGAGGSSGSSMHGIVAATDPAARVAAAFDAVAAYDDPAVFIDVPDRDAALAALDPSLPLAGLTFAVKNNIDVAGFDTTAGCPSFAFSPSGDAPVVERLRAAGATCVGVTNMDQFATGLVGTRSPYGTPRNVVDPLLAPGGSSCGSAVAVAAGLVDVAFGTDTAGSGRVPAAQNRIVGVKPTRGWLPVRGVIPAVQSIDCVSVFSRTVELGMEVTEVCAGWDADDPWSRRPGQPPLVMPTLRVGVPTTPRLRDPLDEAAWRASIAVLARTPDVEVIDIDIAPWLDAGELLYGGPWVAERYVAVGAFVEGGSDDLDPVVASIILAARERTAADAYEAQYRMAGLRRAAERCWAAVDVIVLPTTTGVATMSEVAADPVGRNTELGVYTNGVNLLDQCAIAVPGVDRADGWPFGISVIGPAWSDSAVAALASVFGEDASAPTPWPTGGSIDVAVAGAHLAGQPLNWQLTDLGARFVRAAVTTPAYRLFAMEHTTPPKPALVHTGDPAGGASIEVEVWRLPVEMLGAFSQLIPPPLGLGRLELADGSCPAGFIAEPRAMHGARDITDMCGWRTYLASR